MLITMEHADHIAREEHAETGSLHQIADAPRSMARRCQSQEPDVAEDDRLTPFQLEVHRGWVGIIVGHGEVAEERLTRSARPQDGRVTLSGVDLRPQHRAEVLRSPAVVAVGMGQQYGPHLPPVEPECR